MAIPYYSEIVNDNRNQYESYRDWDNTFIGFLTPNGKVYNAYNNHNITEIIYAHIPCFYFSTGETQNDKLLKLFKMRERELNLSGKKDEVRIEALLVLIDYVIRYYQNYRFPEKELEESGFDKISKRWEYTRKISDFMTQALSFDKVERIRQSITTSKSNIYETFFNYFIMGFDIYQIPKLIYNEKNVFSLQYQSPYIQTGRERECEEEIHLIKKHIPLSERPKYFR